MFTVERRRGREEAGRKRDREKDLCPMAGEQTTSGITTEWKIYNNELNESQLNQHNKF